MTVLFKDPPGMTVPEKLDVGMQGMQIGERCQEIGELGGIVPDPDIFSKLFPAFKVGCKIRAAFLNGFAPVTFNGAEGNQYIVSRPAKAGFPGLLVGQGGNHLVRKLFSHSIYKAYHGSTG